MDSALTSRFGLMESKIREIEDRTKGVDSENVVLREKYEAERTRGNYKHLTTL